MESPTAAMEFGMERVGPAADAAVTTPRMRLSETTKATATRRARDADIVGTPRLNSDFDARLLPRSAPVYTEHSLSAQVSPLRRRSGRGSCSRRRRRQAW